MATGFSSSLRRRKEAGTCQDQPCQVLGPGPNPTQPVCKPRHLEHVLQSVAPVHVGRTNGHDTCKVSEEEVT